MPFAMAGARQEPPVSSHKDQGANLAATAAADPALLPAHTHVQASGLKFSVFLFFCVFSLLVMGHLSGILKAKFESC